jgi:hypothetical protein
VWHEPDPDCHALALVEGTVMFEQIRAVFVLGVATLVVIVGARWHLSRVHAAEQAVHAHYAQVLAGISEKTAAAAAAFRARETAWQTQIEKEARNGQDRIDTARRDATRAGAAADSLRADLARYRAAARAAAHPGAAAAGQSEPSGEAIDLFSELFAGADAAAGELAQAADLARAAGITCEHSYDALINPRRLDGCKNVPQISQVLHEH